MTIDEPATAAPALGLNRCLQIELVREGDAVVGVDLRAPVPGEGLRATRVDAATQAPLFEWLLALRERAPAGRLTLAAEAAARLCSAGVLLPRTRLPRRVRYACFIDRHAGPMALPPALAATSRERWMVNPTLRVFSGTGSFAAPGPLAPLADAPALAWQRCARTGMAFAYWLGEEDAETLYLLAAQRRRPQQIDEAAAWRYARAGLLTTADEWARCGRRLERRRQLQQARFGARGWVALRELLPKPLLASLRDYLDALIGDGHLAFDDGQSRRYHRHSEPLAVWLHQQLQASTERVAGQPIKPSYAFLAGYVGGSDLKPHVDRPQCEYTLSVTLDAQPGCGRDAAWPLGLDDREGRRRWVRLAPGDGLLLKGRELTHFRDPLPEGRRSTSAFLHFVPIGFDSHLD